MTAYVVQRVERTDIDPDDEYGFESYLLGSGIPAAAFTDREAAEACRDRLDAEARGELNLRDVFGGGFGDTGDGWLPGWLTDLGLPLPDVDLNSRYEMEDEDGRRVVTHSYRWEEWWDAVLPELTDARRAAFWARRPGVQYYRVVEVPLED